jgi:hypothetical protein
MTLISLEEAKQHLKVDDAAEDTEIGNLVASASDMIMDYLKRTETGWDEATTPPLVKAATKIILSGLYDDREGTGAGDFFAPNGAVARILARYRDPAIA